MKISGHRTRAVFDRYDIVSEEDVAGVGSESYFGFRVTAEPAFPCVAL
jgi:hypothetical protein